MSLRAFTTTAARLYGCRMAMSRRLSFRNPPRHSLWRSHNPWRERFRTSMSSSTSTAWKSHKFILALALGLLSSFALAQDVALQVPPGFVAGNAATIGTSGSGSATFYLIGPATSIKRDIELGKEISLVAKDLQAAGRYVAVVCSSSCSSQAFFVAPGKPVDLSF